MDTLKKVTILRLTHLDIFGNFWKIIEHFFFLLFWQPLDCSSYVRLLWFVCNLFVIICTTRDLRLSGQYTGLMIYYGNGLKSIRGSWGAIWGQFQGSLTHLGASRGLQSQKRGPFWAVFWPILTFPDPPCQPGQIFLVQNGLYMCPTYSTTCFRLNSHLWGVF